MCKQQYNVSQGWIQDFTKGRGDSVRAEFKAMNVICMKLKREGEGGREWGSGEI